MGEMLVAGTPPLELRRVLELIARDFHRTMDEKLCWKPGYSKGACVDGAMTVCDLLRAAGLSDAQVIPVAIGALTMRCGEVTDRAIYYLGTAPQKIGHWHGHLIATASGYLIDVTLYGIDWSGPRGMFAVPMSEPRSLGQIRGLAAIANLKTQVDDTLYQVTWLANPGNVTSKARNASHAHRSQIVETLLNSWRR